MPTDAEFDRTLAVLDPADRPGLLELYNKPNMPFSLVRPFIDPKPEVIGEMQDDITEIMREHAWLSTWTSAGVRQPPYTGVTYFDGDTTAMANGNIFRGITSFALAVKMCAALPQTAAEAVTGEVGKINSTSLGKPRIFVALGLVCKAALDEYEATDIVTRPFLSKHPRTSPTRVPVYLAYVLERGKPEGKSSYIPVANMRERIEQTIPKDSPVTLGPVRLTVHPPGTSPYAHLKR